MSYLSPIASPIDLGINIDHVATLRNVRGTSYPDPLQAALLAEEAGADAITLHLREDRRHIKDADVIAIRPQLKTRMNLETAVTAEMLKFACAIHPQDVCLVPERRAEITTEGGLDVVTNFAAISAAVKQLQSEKIRVSLFIDADLTQIQAAFDSGAPVIEIHTGRYADAPDQDEQLRELQRIQHCVSTALRQGLIVHAGHGLRNRNVCAIAAIDGISELNIGHAVVADALFVGWQTAIRELKALMLSARRQRA